MSAGTRSELDWLELLLNKKYKAKTQRRGDQPGMNDIRFLSRRVRSTDKGFEIEAGPRHTELITEQLAQ